MSERMRWIVAVTALMTCGLGVPETLACGSYRDRRDAIDVLSEDPRVSSEAIARLRAAGPRGLDVVFATHRDMIDAAGRGEMPPDDPRWLRLQGAIDAVGGQRTCLASRLYWHTDLESAKAEAERTGKLIVSLRLLGRLTDELSCANSRFFRSTLYANVEVSEFLRSKCVLHWESVRPVPVVTIDFGDGRVLRRTVTGNSIHYLLDAEGRVVDALPGLYGPRAFLRELGEAVAMATHVYGMNESDRHAALRQYHHQQLESIAERVHADMEQLGLDPSVHSSPGIDESLWGRLAALHAEDARLDSGSVALIRAQQPTRAIFGLALEKAGAAGIAIGRGPRIPAELAGAVSVGKGLIEDPILRLVRSFEAATALDTVRNEYELHRTIHEWLAAGTVPLTMPVNQLNERVYAELFLTPSSDPWLGLMADEMYTALHDSGIASH